MLALTHDIFDCSAMTKAPNVPGCQLFLVSDCLYTLAVMGKNIHSVDIGITYITPHLGHSCFVLELVAGSEQYSDAYTGPPAQSIRFRTAYICQLTAHIFAT